MSCMEVKEGSRIYRGLGRWGQLSMAGSSSSDSQVFSWRLSNGVRFAFL